MIHFTIKKQYSWDFPRGPVVKNPPYNAGDTGLTHGQGTKIPHATGQLSPCAATTEPACRKLQSPRTTTRENPVHRKEEPAAPQRKILRAATKT